MLIEIDSEIEVDEEFLLVRFNYRICIEVVIL